jgi:anaerobic magnesium-protoporphyrin IX monomethyl ester cyclase
MLKHVLCVYPYRRELNDVGFFPPLGLEYIAMITQPFSRETEIVDLRRDPGRTQDFIRPETEMVLLSVNWNRDHDFLAHEIRSIPTEICTILGGRHATEDPQRWLEEFPNVAAVVRGDGEEAMEEICHRTPLEKITGLSFRSGDQIIHNPNRVPGPVPDALFPDRTLRKHRYDIILGDAGTGLEIDLVASSRGCPFNCNFCSFNRNPWGTKRKWSARSPESVVAELEEIRAPIIGFTDDLFTFDADRVERICDLLLAKGIRKKYLINARLEIAKRPDVLRKMEAAGFFLMMVGIESAHDRTLKSMQKGFDTAQIRKYFQVLNKTKMLLHGYFIMGNIGESRQDMEVILPFARDLGLDTIALSTLRVSPHSGLDELVAANPGYHVGSGGKVFSDECSVKDLRNLRRQINRKFYNTSQILRIARKGWQHGFLRFLPGALPRLPGIAWRVAAHQRRRNKRRRGKKRDT